MAQDRASVDLRNIRHRVENARSDKAWQLLPLSKKIRLLLEERLDQIEKEAQDLEEDPTEKPEKKQSGK
ncbi:MAG: hypothetical protein F6K47_04235 [Symploca sp. SIO2E6]|nr:hypothetical protein [Symploca sp. SIO2E6]